MPSILIMHRDPNVAALVVRELSEGHTISTKTTTGSASDPNSFPDLGDVDLLILGMRFPSGNRDGYEFVSEVRRRGYAFPIVIFTGGGGELPEGADALVQMPVKASALVETVSDLLAGG